MGRFAVRDIRADQPYRANDTDENDRQHHYMLGDALTCLIGQESRHFV